MTSVDLAKAFDRVSLAAILRATERIGMMETYTNHVHDLYETGSTVLTFEYKSLLEHPTQGVQQGDQVSPVLFNMVLNEWPCQKDHGVAFHSEDLEVSAMTFADDLAVCASKPYSLQQRLNSLPRFLALRGYQINAEKSLTILMQPAGKKKKVKIMDTCFHIRYRHPHSDDRGHLEVPLAELLC